MSKKFKVKKPQSQLDDTLVSKLIAPAKNEGRVNKEELDSIVRDTEFNMNNVETMLTLFPDLELSIQILTSSIISPNDMVGDKYNIGSSSTLIPNSVKLAMLDKIKTDLNGFYDLDAKLPQIVREAKYTKGAWVEAIVPENVVDSLLSDIETKFEAGVESYLDVRAKVFETKLGSIRPKGRTDDATLGRFVYDDLFSAFNTFESGLESFASMTTFSEANTTNVENRYKEMAGLEANVDGSKKLVIDKLFRTLSAEERTVVNADIATEKNSVGRPMLMRINVESVIPVYSPNDVSDHIGYFILLDEAGSPISMGDIDAEEDKNSRKIESVLVAKAKKSLAKSTKKSPTMKDVSSVFSKLFDKRIHAIITKDNKFATVSDDDKNDIYKIMLQRSLRQQKTRILYMPRDMLNYIAVDWRNNGTGRSELEKLSPLSSLRSILLISRVMAVITNNIPLTKISAKLDDDDIDPRHTMERVISEAMKTRGNRLPMGIPHVPDLVNWAQRVGFSFQFEHPALPDMVIDTEERIVDRAEPDGTLDELIGKYMITGLGLPVELVDDARGPEFATTAIINNSLLMRRIFVNQQGFNRPLTRYVKSVVNNDRQLYDVLSGIVEENWSAIKAKFPDEVKTALKGKSVSQEELIEYVVTDFRNKLTFALPAPILPSDGDNLKEMMSDYSDSLDDAIEHYLSSDALPTDLVGSVSDYLETFKTVAKSTLMRKWLEENGNMPELSDILSYDDDGKPKLDVFDDFSAFSKSIVRAMIPFLKDNEEILEDIEKKFGKLEIGKPEEVAPAPSEETPGDDGLPPDESGEGDEIEEGGTPAPSDEPLPDDETGEVDDGGDTGGAGDDDGLGEIDGATPPE